MKNVVLAPTTFTPTSTKLRVERANVAAGVNWDELRHLREGVYTIRCRCKLCRAIMDRGVIVQYQEEDMHFLSGPYAATHSLPICEACIETINNTLKSVE